MIGSLVKTARLTSSLKFINFILSPSDVSELANNAAMRVVNFIEPTKFRMVDESLDSYLRLGCVLMVNVK
jgi:hypothetical protein